VSLSGNPSLLRVMIVRDPCLVNEKSVINKYGRWKKWIINNKKKRQERKSHGRGQHSEEICLKYNWIEKKWIKHQIYTSTIVVLYFLLKTRLFTYEDSFTILYGVYFYRIVYRKRRLYGRLFLYILQGSIKNQSSWEKNKPVVDSHGRASGNGFITYFICTFSPRLGWV